MEITNELLAAYAEGNVTPEERKQVRQYLTEHPSQLESVMLMMDSDDDVEIEVNVNGSWALDDVKISDSMCLKEMTHQKGTILDLIKKSVDFTKKMVNKYGKSANSDRTFAHQLNELFDDINNL